MVPGFLNYNPPEIKSFTHGPRIEPEKYSNKKLFVGISPNRAYRTLNKDDNSVHWIITLKTTIWAG